MTYEIIATLGPSSNTPTLWRDLVHAGASAFRLNTSHISTNELKDWLERLSQFWCDLGQVYPVYIDLQGSKWRLGTIEDIQLQPGHRVKLTNARQSKDPLLLPIPHADFFEAASQFDGNALLNDGKTELRLESAKGSDTIEAIVLRGGSLSSRKGINLPDCGYRKNGLNERDIQIVEIANGYGFIRFAVSYVKDAVEWQSYRQVLGLTHSLCLKIERQSAIDDFAALSKWDDEMWLCRGDLGSELGIKAMAETVHRLAPEVTQAKNKIILAGQVLEHMTHHQNPTRSEISYLHLAPQMGFKGFVLSDETAIGSFPVQACQQAALFKQRQ